MSEIEPNFESSLDTNTGAEWWSEVTQEDIVRVREWESNAKQMAGQIAKSQKTNKQFALMLSFIFKYIEDEFLLTYVFETMSDFDQSVISIFAHFLPNLQSHMDIEPYKPLYAEVWNNLESRDWSLTKVAHYYKELYIKFPGIGRVPKNLYIDMIIKQLEIQGIISWLDVDALMKVREGLFEEIYENYKN